MDRSKTHARKTKKGEEWGAARRPPSEGRERRRRRAEDVGVVLGEAARVRDVGLFHEIADVRPELRRRAARAPVLGEERRRRRQEQVVVDGRRGPRRPRARARRRAERRLCNCNTKDPRPSRRPFRAFPSKRDRRALLGEFLRRGLTFWWR